MDRSAALTRKSALNAPRDDLEVGMWDGVGTAERFAEACRLSEELWRLKGWQPGEPGLSRSVARLVRR